MVRIPTHRPPTHPGQMILEEFLNPMSLTQRELADAIHVPYPRINDIVHGRRSMTTSTALRLAKLFKMSADFWMNLRMRWDIVRVISTSKFIEMESFVWTRKVISRFPDF
jgi:addiction module HigA family antidote